MNYHPKVNDGYQLQLPRSGSWLTRGDPRLSLSGSQYTGLSRSFRISSPILWILTHSPLPSNVRRSCPVGVFERCTTTGPSCETLNCRNDVNTLNNFLTWLNG